MSAALTEVALMIQRESGIALSPTQLPSLQAAITRVDRQLTAESLLTQNLSPHTLERLIDEITIRETFFFRHRSELDTIDWYPILDAARARGAKHIRIWIAGCASGEEAYTIAILASRAFASASPPVRVLATDIAPTALEQAAAGCYGARATRTVPADIRERYFTAEDGILSVQEQLRVIVEFRRHNLVRDPCPPAGEQRFDVILCRNVLIYFDRPTVEHVLSGLESALTPSGLLLLGAADRLSGQSPHNQPHATGAQTDRQPSRTLPSARKALRPPSVHPQRQTATPVEFPTLGATPTPPRASAPAATATEATKAADRGEIDLAVQIATQALAHDPLDADAHFIRGLAEHARGNPQAAIEPLRRVLYIDPNHIRAAFNLARAYDALGETSTALRAYQRTLRILDQYTAKQPAQSDRLDLLDITTACHTRQQTLQTTRHPQ